MADLLANGIDVYPQKEFDEDSEDRLVNEKFRVSACGCGLDVFGWGLQLWGLKMSLRGFSCKGSLFSFQRPCPQGLPGTKDPTGAQSRDRGRCPLLSMQLLLPLLHSSKVPSATSKQRGLTAPCLPQAWGVLVSAMRAALLPWLSFPCYRK